MNNIVISRGRLIPLSMQIMLMWHLRNYSFVRKQTHNTHGTTTSFRQTPDKSCLRLPVCVCALSLAYGHVWIYGNWVAWCSRKCCARQRFGPMKSNFGLARNWFCFCFTLTPIQQQQRMFLCKCAGVDTQLPAFFNEQQPHVAYKCADLSVCAAHTHDNDYCPTISRRRSGAHNRVGCRKKWKKKERKKNS